MSSMPSTKYNSHIKPKAQPFNIFHKSNSQHLKPNLPFFFNATNLISNISRPTPNLQLLFFCHKSNSHHLPPNTESNTDLLLPQIQSPTLNQPLIFCCHKSNLKSNISRTTPNLASTFSCHYSNYHHLPPNTQSTIALLHPQIKLPSSPTQHPIYYYCHKSNTKHIYHLETFQQEHKIAQLPFISLFLWLYPYLH